MTGEDFEQRLRKVEDWCLRHAADCNGRHEHTMSVLESLQRSLEKETAVGKATDSRVDRLTQDMSDLKIKLAFVAGVCSAGGGAVGTWLTNLLFGG